MITSSCEVAASMLLSKEEFMDIKQELVEGTLLHCTKVYCNVLYCTAVYCAVLCVTVLYCIEKE